MQNRKCQKLVFLIICALALPALARQGDAGPPGTTTANEPGMTSAGRGIPVDAATEARIRAALVNLSPNLVLDYLGPSIVPGYQEIIVNGQAVFVTDDGHYLIQGLMDLRDKRDISLYGALPELRRKVLAESPLSERIVFAPDGPIKHTVSVFTDVECGFCQKLHQDMSEYNKLGISVEYLAYPRAGTSSPDAAKMTSAWCSSDRRKALTDAKRGVAIPTLECDNPVAKQYAIGKRVGLQGTPMIINADGVALSGYMPPADLLKALDKLAAERKSE